MAEKEKGKRIAPEDFWKLSDVGKKLEKMQRKYQKWLRKEARQAGCYFDQIANVLSGKIVMDPTKEHPQGEVRRMSDEFLEAAETRFDDLRVVSDEHSDLCDKLTRDYGVAPDLLDPKTGIIRVDDNIAAEKKSIIEPIEDNVTGTQETGRPEKSGTDTKE